MKRLSKVALFALVVGALAGISSSARAQGMKVDPNLAKRGKQLWLSRSCDACHSIGHGRRAGPDLMGVTTRRSTAWLKKWLHDPAEMLATDSTAMALLAEASNVKMINPKLTDSEIDALINYLADESRKGK